MFILIYHEYYFSPCGQYKAGKIHTLTLTNSQLHSKLYDLDMMDCDGPLEWNYDIIDVIEVEGEPVRVKERYVKKYV